MSSPRVAIKLFLSTPSVRRATTRRKVDLANLLISIHALREVGDLLHPQRWTWIHDFYPRPP